MLSIADHQIVIRGNYNLLGEWLTVTTKSSTSLHFSVRDCHQTSEAAVVHTYSGSPSAV